MPRSFADLEKDLDVTVNELKEVLHDYVATGAAIKASVVIALIDRVNGRLNKDDQIQLIEDAKSGFWDQTFRAFYSEADEYKEVVFCLHYVRV